MIQTFGRQNTSTPQSDEDCAALRNDAMNCFQISQQRVGEVLCTQASGSKLTSAETSVLSDFKNAMHMVDEVIAHVPCSYIHWRTRVEAKCNPVQSATGAVSDYVCLDTGASSTIVPPGTLKNLNTGDVTMFGGFNGTGQRSKGTGSTKFTFKDSTGLPASIDIERGHEVDGAGTTLMCLKDVFKHHIQIHGHSADDIHLKFPSGQKVLGRLSDEGILLFDLHK